MKDRVLIRYIVLSLIFVAFPFRIVTDSDGKFGITLPSALAASGSGSDGDDGGDGGDDGEGGGDDGDDGGSGNDGGDDGESGDDGGDDGDDGESGDDGGDDGDDGESGDDSGDDGEDGESGDDSGDDGDDGESGDDSGGDGDDRESGKSEVTSGKSDRPTAKSTPSKAEKLPNGARVTFNDGSREEIVAGEFLRTNARGQILDRRRARGSDLARMRSIFGKLNTSPSDAIQNIKARATRAKYSGRNIEITYSNGWLEQVIFGKYTLTDQFGRVVASRRATNADIERLNRYRK